MTSYVYRPDHPDADEFGMVDKKLLIQSYVDATHVITDNMDQLRNMADGKYYDSKSEFRKATKAAGCIEYGSEIPTLLKPRQRIPYVSGKQSSPEEFRARRREDIRKALYEVRNGVKR